MDTRRVVDAITAITENYREMALRAVKQGDGKLYIAGYMSREDFIRLAQDPSLITGGNQNEKEPAYLSLEEGQRGGNRDGSRHNGFIVIDVLDHTIVDVVDRNGVSSLKNFGQSYRHGEPFADWMGAFVLIGNNGWPYKSASCRCPMIAYDVFDTRTRAEAAREELPKTGMYDVHEITAAFISHCGPSGHYEA